MTNKKELDKFAEESIPILKKYGYLNKKNNVIPLIFFLLGIIFLGILGYAVDNDKFKSDITQNVSVEPEIQISNDYQFTPETNNNYTFNPNFTIVNNIFCPT